jgi:aldose 1-epimerase
LDGKDYVLTKNHGDHSLHGGIQGFDKKYWTILESDSTSVLFEYISAHMEEGFPGQLRIHVYYRLGEQGLTIDMKAQLMDESPVTLINLTNHTYFNLNGFQEPIHEHELWMPSDMSVLEIKPDQIPTGKEIENEPLFDFSKKHSLKEGIMTLQGTIGGYDHFWKLKTPSFELKPIVQLSSPMTGIQMTVYTNRSGCQIYTGNFLQDIHGKACYQPHSGICIETSDPPDAIHHSPWASWVLLHKGREYHHMVKYKF